MIILLIANWAALLISLFVVGCLIGALVSPWFRTKLEYVIERITGLSLSRVRHNPLLAPTKHPWEMEAVLNPAAVNLAGRTHLIYRAIGTDGLSRLGYAGSEDGLVVDDRLPVPAYTTPAPTHQGARQYSPVMYPSGGSWGGCEDPRMVVLEGRVYVTYNLFDNWTLRVGCVSMPEADFLAKRFHKWEGPIILSSGTRDKNWVLFPEKINGKFAVLHSIIGESPDRVRVEYADSLSDLRSRRFVSPDPQRAKDTKIAWHTHVRSAGPPPLKTDRGWLVFYHAHDTLEPSKYKLGAMLLDLKDPTKILHRAPAPVLSPDSPYENHGKPGVIYACGAVVRDGTLFVYYGGADKVVCAATAPLKEFLDALTQEVRTTLVSTPLTVPL